MRRFTLLRLAAVVAVLVFLLPAPASAHTSLVLKASGAQTTAGNGSAVEIGSFRRATIYVNVTAGSGTVNPFRVWIEGSPDGTNWYELPCDLILKAGTAAPGAGAVNQRDIVNEAALVTSQKYVANCEIFTSTIRAAWNIAGATPSETFDITMAGK
jgi:hypothetical protein